MVQVSIYRTCLNNLNLSKRHVKSEPPTVLDRVKNAKQDDAEYWYAVFLENNVHDIFDLLSYIQTTRKLDNTDFAVILGISNGHLKNLLAGVVVTLCRSKYKPILKDYVADWVLDIYFDDNERFKRRK